MRRCSTYSHAVVINYLDVSVLVLFLGKFIGIAPQILVVEQHITKRRCDVVNISGVVVQTKRLTNSNTVRKNSHKSCKSFPLFLERIVIFYQTRCLDIGIFLSIFERVSKKISSCPNTRQTGNHSVENISVKIFCKTSGFYSLDISRTLVKQMP